MAFGGLRVLAFESRRAAQTAELIRRHEGEPFVAPALREAPLETQEQAFRFAERLVAGEFDMVIFLTGVGARALRDAVAGRYPAGRLADALRRVTTVARGPKPAAALRDMGAPVGISVPAPNTWREVLAATSDRPERRIAVQEYGRPNPELLEALRARGAEVTPVRVYRWELPEDTAPLREAARRIASGGADVVLFTTAMHAVHLFRLAAELGLEDRMRAGLRRAAVVSIGPTTTEMLEDYGIVPDLAPSQAKLGILVKEAAEQAAGILTRKRAAEVGQA